MNAAKDGEKRVKCEEWGEKNSHWHVGPDLEKVQLFGPFVGNSRGRIQVGTEAHHVLRFNHWKSDERAKTQAERLMKPLKSNENTSSITESKAFFSGAFALSVFSVPGSFCWLYKWTCYRAPLLTSLSENGKTQIRRCTQLHESVPECGSAQHILTQRSTRPHRSRSTKIPGITVNRTISFFIAGKKTCSLRIGYFISKPSQFGRMVYWLTICRSKADNINSVLFFTYRYRYCIIKLISIHIIKSHGPAWLHWVKRAASKAAPFNVQ